MNPFVCQKCGKPLHGHSFLQCVIDQRDQLQAWKESAMTVEREWDPNQLAAMLGGKLGEPQRAVIQREVPRLVQRVKRLEKMNQELAEALERIEFCLPAGFDRVPSIESALGRAHAAIVKAKGQP